MDTQIKLEPSIVKEKLSDNTMKITKTIVPEPIVTEETYDYDFLVEQLARIEKQKAEQMDARDREIAEIKNLLAQADEVGIKSRGISSAAIQEAMVEQFTK